MTKIRTHAAAMLLSMTSVLSVVGVGQSSTASDVGPNAAPQTSVDGDSSYYYAADVRVSGERAGEATFLAIPLPKSLGGGWFVREKVDATPPASGSRVLYDMSAELGEALEVQRLELEIRVGGVTKEKSLVTREGARWILTQPGQDVRLLEVPEGSTASLASLVLLARALPVGSGVVKRSYLRTTDWKVVEAELRPLEVRPAEGGLEAATRSFRLDVGVDPVTVTLAAEGGKILSILRPEQSNTEFRRLETWSREGRGAFEPESAPDTEEVAGAALLFAVFSGQEDGAVRHFDVPKISKSSKARGYDALQDQASIVGWVRQRARAQQGDPIPAPLRWVAALDNARVAPRTPFGVQYWADGVLRMDVRAGAWMVTSIMSSEEVLLEPTIRVRDPRMAVYRLMLAMMLNDGKLLDSVVSWERWGDSAESRGPEVAAGSRREFLRAYLESAPALDRRWASIREFVSHLNRKFRRVEMSQDVERFTYEGLGSALVRRVDGEWKVVDW